MVQFRACTAACVVIVLALAAPVRGEQQGKHALDSLWTTAAHEFSDTIAMYNAEFRAILEPGTPSGPMPPVNCSVKFDASNRDITADAVAEGLLFEEILLLAKQYVSVVAQELLRGEGADLAALFTDPMRPVYDEFAVFIQDHAAAMQAIAGEGASFEGGAGLGFGVNVLDCHKRRILSMGAGIGFGFSISSPKDGVPGDFTSGIGGGGGITLRARRGDSKSTVANLGGGGGGGLSLTSGRPQASFGSTPDSGQTVPASLREAYDALASACHPLHISGSGGGGGGFLSKGVDDGMRYGGGTSFGLGEAYASGGTGVSTNSGDDTGNGAGRKIGHVYTTCRKDCQGRAYADTAANAFWSCFCPCTKEGVTKIGAQWASSIKCSGA